MPVERGDRSLVAGDVVAEGTQQRAGIEAWRRGLIGRLAPQAEAAFGEPLPGKVDAGIDLAPGRDVAVADEIRRGNAVALLQIGEQRQQCIDLRVRVGFGAIIVQLDADGGRIHVKFAAPVGRSRVPGALQFVDQVKQPAVALDEVMRAHLGGRTGERPQGPRRIGAASVVQDHKARAAFVEVH